MSNNTSPIRNSFKRPYEPLLETEQTSKKTRLDDGPENSAASQVELLHPPGLNELASAATMDDREEKLVCVFGTHFFSRFWFCNFGTHLLENKSDVASAKFLETELAKIYSTDPRIDTLCKKILERTASNSVKYLPLKCPFWKHNSFILALLA